MVEHDVERSAAERDRPRGELLVGPGRRARAAGGVPAALSALDEEGERRREPLREVVLVDLEELLAPRPLEGLLILESGRVPGEDIGFVRRFLERHSGWRLVLTGEDAQAPAARALLALGRAQWLRWPPDLGELRAFLTPLSGGTPARSAPAGGDERPRRGARRATTNGAVDLAELLEELLAGAALQGEGTPRFQFRPAGTVLVKRERALLTEGLGGLVELARVSAGADGLVSVAVVNAAEAVQVGLEFPRGELAEKELSTLLERAPAGVDAALARGLAAARHGCALLRAAGDQVELSGAESGRLRCEVRCPLRPGSAPAQRSASRSTRAGKAEDPFA